MSNVVAFQPKLRPDRAQNLAALLEGVSQHRRRPDDVFWLKENAELLNLLVATSEPLMPGALAPFETFYDEIEERLRFYPQYYRFFLSICLDLEDLGLDGCKGERLCDWVASVGLAEAELSDLQRAEARRLLARRGAADVVSSGDLVARLRRFVERPETFALPNKKAAYELTHIVYYLSEYGKYDPELRPEAMMSLEYTGLVAYLDQNHDLLAEVCTAIQFAGGTPSQIWVEDVSRAHAGIMPVPAETEMPVMDAFHAYLVTGWGQAVAGAPCFEAEVPQGGVQFVDQLQAKSALRGLSEFLFDLGAARHGDWSGMRGRVIPFLDAHSRAIVQRAEASSERFGDFFEGFARNSGS
ncbi:hypothetical protein GV827_00655 [Sulfitobacter sp. JBTF-M27]|uniref:Uncharacterized protein n=1 Tax=Sulfitobacter sediminilitoris TaxID=2698830 RepID=A0A6P0C446_9RHOB|nr:hypothetical protein [Sulfitobacter sediminilitoris]NEK20911.1 hypothetical protein [Sulfitobacter sediminilitoris]